MRQALILAIAPLLLLGGANWGSKSGDISRKLTVGGITREYLLHVPGSLPADKLAPLVMVFHGGLGRGRGMPEFTHFDRVADEHGFIVAYPYGVNGHWNDTRGFSSADDVGFARALIADVQHSYRADSKRVYASGISNGGFFSNRLACELADQIAAIAVVAATMPEKLVPDCKPVLPMSVMFIQGTNDPLVPINGGQVARNRGVAISLSDAAKFWIERDHASSAP
ncbi:MAG: PHB depolymerase family esterase, partial [Terriglobales bacterium]